MKRFPGIEFVVDATAKKMYTKYTDNHSIIHSNRFPSWDELSISEKDSWYRKAEMEIEKSIVSDGSYNQPG